MIVGARNSPSKKFPENLTCGYATVDDSRLLRVGWGRGRRVDVREKMVT